MSYRIEYGEAAPVRYQRPRGQNYPRTLTALCMILFALAVGRYWPRGQQVLRDFLLPGAPTVTERAFSELVSDLTQGVGLEEAMSTFCQQIIDHGSGKSD